MFTYFIASDNSVKIGRTAHRPSYRLDQLQTANQTKLRILCILEGDREKELHEKFARYHKRGEWFKLSDEILDFIDDELKQKKPFRRWLLDQRKRRVEDEIGHFAFRVAGDPLFPKSGKLCLVLRHYDHNPNLRKIAKRAWHAWRRYCKKFDGGTT